MFYFAYGSNMNHEQMKERCPESNFLKRVYLVKKHKLIFDGKSEKWGGAVANIIKSEVDAVWGGLFEISQGDLKSLDSCEGYPTYYNREEFDVKDDKEKLDKAIVYFRTGKEPGSPSEKYRDIIMRGAQDCGLSEEYIKTYIQK